LRQIHSLFQVGAFGDLTDGQLLERFMTGHKESAEPAFTALVERHGPMVWRVSWSDLRSAVFLSNSDTASSL